MQYVSQFFSILNDVFLKMTWLSDLIAWIVNNIFRLPINDTDIWGKIGGSLQFFIYDSIKIIALLSVLIFIFSYVESKFTPEKTKRLLSKLAGIVLNKMLMSTKKYENSYYYGKHEYKSTDLISESYDFSISEPTIKKEDEVLDELQEYLDSSRDIEKNDIRKTKKGKRLK